MKGRFYIYCLIDPRSDISEPFYIGKGCGNRMFAHEAAVRRGSEKNPVKRAIIQDIWDAGLEVKKGILFRSDDEAKAYAQERRLISLLKPKANLAHGTTKVVTFFGMISEMCRTWRDTRDEFKRRFPREVIERVYPPEMLRLYDSILKSPRFKTLEGASG